MTQACHGGIRRNTATERTGGHGSISGRRPGNRPSDSPQMNAGPGRTKKINSSNQSGEFT
jgi:hypothetical protein